MLLTSNAQKFHQELSELLVKYKVDTYLFAAAVQDEAKDATEVPLMFHVTGDPERRLSPQRLAAAFSESVLGGVLRMLMHHNGLSLYQATGAVGESVKYAAAEIEQQVEQQRALVAHANSLPDA